MSPFIPTPTTDTELENIVNATVRRWELGDPAMKSMMAGVTRRADAVHAIRAMVKAEFGNSTIYNNDEYHVAQRKLGGDSVHLAIRRIDRQPITAWEDLQTIKNMLVGPECEAVELFPAESRLVKNIIERHLWCSADTTFRFSFGFFIEQ